MYSYDSYLENWSRGVLVGHWGTNDRTIMAILLLMVLTCRGGVVVVVVEATRHVRTRRSGRARSTHGRDRVVVRVHRRGLMKIALVHGHRAVVRVHGHSTGHMNAVVVASRSRHVLLVVVVIVVAVQEPTNPAGMVVIVLRVVVMMVGVMDLLGREGGRDHTSSSGWDVLRIRGYVCRARGARGCGVLDIVVASSGDVSAGRGRGRGCGGAVRDDARMDVVGVYVGSIEAMVLLSCDGNGVGGCAGLLLLVRSTVDGGTMGDGGA